MLNKSEGKEKWKKKDRAIFYMYVTIKQPENFKWLCGINRTVLGPVL